MFVHFIQIVKALQVQGRSILQNTEAEMISQQTFDFSSIFLDRLQQLRFAN